MATFEIWHPTELADDSYRWLPSIDPVSESSADRLLSSSIVHRVGAAVYVQEMAPPLPVRRWTFDGLSNDDRTGFLVFRAQVSAAVIRLRDPWTIAAGIGGYVNAQLFGSGLDCEFTRVRPAFWRVSLEFLILPG